MIISIKNKYFGANDIKDKVTSHLFTQLKFFEHYIKKENRVMSNTILPFIVSLLEKSEASKQLQLIT